MSTYIANHRLSKRSENISPAEGRASTTGIHFTCRSSTSGTFQTKSKQSNLDLRRINISVTAVRAWFRVSRNFTFAIGTLNKRHKILSKIYSRNNVVYDVLWIQKSTQITAVPSGNRLRSSRQPPWAEVYQPARLLEICFLREAPERAIGSDRRRGNGGCLAVYLCKINRDDW
jgi:hypothetical protein